MFTYAGGSAWVVWPSERQMGQTEPVESRLDFMGHVFPLQHVSLQWNKGAWQSCHFLISNELAGLGNGVIVSRNGSESAVLHVTQQKQTKRKNTSSLHDFIRALRDNTLILFYPLLFQSTAHSPFQSHNKFTAHLPSFPQILMIKWGNCPK